MSANEDILTTGAEKVDPAAGGGVMGKKETLVCPQLSRLCCSLMPRL